MKLLEFISRIEIRRADNAQATKVRHVQMAYGCKRALFVARKTLRSMPLRALFIAATTLFFPQLTLAEMKSLDKVVAVVDSNVILRSELEERIVQVAARARANGMALPKLDALKEQVLDHLITEKLQLQVAKRVGFNAPDEQVNQTIEQIRTSNNLSMEQFKQQLQMEGLSFESYRESVRKDITLQQIQQGMVQQRIQISPLEIDNFLSSADARFWMGGEYHVGHILVSLPQSPTTADVETARQKAEVLVAKIRNGTPFAEVAIAESNGPAALNGGDMGWRKTSELPSLFADIVPKLEVGAVSDPARSGAGYHILTVYGKKGDNQQMQTQTKARHILLKPSAILTNEEAEAKLSALRKKILGGADFAELAKEHSEDIGSMLSGGELGWSSPGMFVPAFEKVLNTTAVGEISQPFRSQFGWHILQVMERRDEDISDAILRDKAARVLTNRRFEDELQIWLRELRDDAFVEIKK